MTDDFTQIRWDELVADDCRQLVQLAVREDLDRGHDWTTLALVGEQTEGRADVVARQDGILAGLPAAALALEVYDARARFLPHVADGDFVRAGQVVASVEGRARTLLTAERLLLNLIGRLSGVATQTRQYIDAVAGTKARVYDTRKTTPGWRRLEKYAVGCGGGHNHRTGLFDAVLIKDNHLALGSATAGDSYSPADAVTRAREFLGEMFPDGSSEEASAKMLIEVEVDSLDQLRCVLPVGPDIVLLDNMSCEQLREAVTLRDSLAGEVQLEASGGVRLETIRQIAESGVDRISVGALTHSVMNFDVALDWDAE